MCRSEAISRQSEIQTNDGMVIIVNRLSRGENPALLWPFEASPICSSATVGLVISTKQLYLSEPHLPKFDISRDLSIKIKSEKAILIEKPMIEKEDYDAGGRGFQHPTIVRWRRKQRYPESLLRRHFT